MPQLVMYRPNLDTLAVAPELPPGYVLRDYGAGDLDGLAALLRMAFECDTWTVERVVTEFVNDVRVKRTFVVDCNGEVVATASAYREDNDSVGVLHWVAAHPAYSGNGLGYIVSLAVLHALACLGCRSTLLRTDDHRLPAIQTYRKLGYAPDLSYASVSERWTAILALLDAKGAPPPGEQGEP